MISPLVENVNRRRVNKSRNAVLGNYRKAERCDKLVYAVVDLGVDVIRSARNNDYLLSLAACVRDYLARLFLYVPAVAQLCGVCHIQHAQHLLFGDVIPCKALCYNVCNVLFHIDVKIRRYEVLVGELVVICF